MNIKKKNSGRQKYWKKGKKKVYDLQIDIA